MPVGWTEVLDVLTVAALLWLLLVWLRRARARLALLGVAISGGVYMAARLLGLSLTAWILQGFFAVLVVVLVVVFQEDLRRLFERIAVWGLRRRPVVPTQAVADVLVRTVTRLAEQRVGALIVIPGSEPLERHVEGGIPLDALVSEPLLLSIFDTSSPGHDGAVLLSSRRAARFALHLPLSTNQAALGPGGTRHAAALGLAERTDCLCIVVSEERGTVSVARDGEIRVLQRPQDLLAELVRFEQYATPPPSARGWRAAVGYWREGLLALALASALWLVRVPGSTVEEFVRSAPVVVEKLPPEFVLESVDPPRVEVRLSGRRRNLLFRPADGVEVHIDALLAKLGRRTFQVTPDDVHAPPDLTVESVEPSQVRLSLETRDAGAAD